MTTAVHSLPAFDAVRSRSRSASGLAWTLFLLLNATLFMRPAEIVPQLSGLPIYEVLIVACLATSFPLILRQLELRTLRTRPITVCVLALLPAIFISNTLNGEYWRGRDNATEFFKVIAYFLLLVSLVNSPRRLRQFLLMIVVCALAITTLALLRYHHLIELNTVAPMEEGQFTAARYVRHRVVVVRLAAAGIFGNPNDLARLVALGITICLFPFAQKRPLAARAVWLIPLAIFGYALRLTYSRGGLLALLAGLVVLFHARFGAKKGAAIILLLLPLLIFFAGRQTDIETSSGTGQLRIQLWSHGLVALRSSPLIGIGAGKYFRMAGNHAHNSFVEAYVETGVLGGTFFFAAFYLTTRGLYRLKSQTMRPNDPELWPLHPFILAMVVGTIVSQFSSSREYSLPTYMILGLGELYLAMAAQEIPESATRVTSRLATRVCVLSLCFLASLHLYTKFNAHF